jgi:hypothetical protein
MCIPMKKEIWMEKLAELLREYNMSNKSPYILWDADYYVDGGLYAPQIISKSRWFIKWLVENKKIAYDIPNNSDLYKCFELACVPLDNTDYITMLLSIQDSPINFLISILK